MGIMITDKTDGKKKYRRSYEDYEELPSTQSPETTTEEPQPTETPLEDEGKAEDEEGAK